ncbi:hypothetical protein D3C84_1070060 [compost metagenome]
MLAIDMFTAFFYSRISVYGGQAGVSPTTVDASSQLNVLTPYMRGLNDVFLLALLCTSLSIPLALLLRNHKHSAARSS